MKKLFLALASTLALGGFATPVLADQILPVQSFAGTTPGISLVGQGDWLRRGTTDTPAINVVSGSLTYAPGGIPASSGNSVSLTTTALAASGEDVRIVFPTDPLVYDTTPGDGRTYYYSYILQWDGTAPGSNSTYLSGFIGSDGGSSTLFRGLVRVIGDGVDLRLGTQLGATTADNDIVPVAATLPANTPVFVVIKVTEIAGARNDISQLFYFNGVPVPDTEPATADATSQYNISGTGEQDIAALTAGLGGLQQFSLRQFRPGTGTYPGNFLVDEVRIGTTWAAVTSDDTPSFVSDWSMYN